MTANNAWQRSKRCDYGGSCVEIAPLGNGIIGIRDSKQDGGPVLSFTRAELAAFAESYVAGEFEAPPL